MVCKCRRSSVLDVYIRTLPRFRCRFDSDRPLHNFSHLQQQHFQRGTPKDQLLFLPPAGSIQPTSDVLRVSPVSKPVRKRPELICCLRAEIHVALAR